MPRPKQKHTLAVVDGGRMETHQDLTNWAEEYGQSISFDPDRQAEIERSCIGSALFSRAALADVVSSLTEADFVSPGHREMFTALVRIHDRGEAADLVVLAQELGPKLAACGGENYLIQVAEFVPSPANSPEYCACLQASSRRRTMAHALVDGMRGIVENRPTADVLGEISLRLEECGPPAKGETLAQAAKAVLDEIDASIETGESLGGLATGLVELDVMTGGLMPGHLIVPCARPSVGKTALACKLAWRAARTGHVMFWSLEMTAPELARRFGSIAGNLNTRVWRDLGLAKEQYAAIGEAMAEVYVAPITIRSDSWPTIDQICAETRAAAAEQPLALVVVDYIQLVGVAKPTDNRASDVGTVSRKLKALAMELQVPVLALSQLNRNVEHRVSKRPSMGDLRESGAIEQDADVVIGLYREDYYETEKAQADPKSETSVDYLELCVIKNRGAGGVGNVVIGYCVATGRMVSLTHDLISGYWERQRS